MIEGASLHLYPLQDSPGEPLKALDRSRGLPHTVQKMCVFYLQRATFAALRCFYVARSYLATSKAVEAMGLFQRTSDRFSQAEQAWDDLEHPDEQALKDLQALKEQAVVRPSMLQNCGELITYIACGRRIVSSSRSCRQ